MEFFSKYDTHAKRCGRHVTAWFGEAEPKILWRAGKDDASGAFWLRRHGNGWTEIVKRDRAGGETTIASFARGDSAEHALKRLEQAFTGRRFGVWRLLLWVLAALGAIFIALNVYSYVVYRQAQATASRAAAYQAPPGPSFAAPARTVQQPASNGPVPGAPVDADSVLH